MTRTLFFLSPTIAAAVACGARSDIDTSAGFGNAGPASASDAGVPGCTGGGNAIGLSVGGNACVVTKVGAVECWGNNKYGTLGDTTSMSSSVPVTIKNLTMPVQQISSGETMICALTPEGGVECWGFLNVPASSASATPLDVPMPAGGASAVSVGYDHACVVTSKGGVKCWGTNASGALGDDVAELSSSMPVDVHGLTSGVSAISAGYGHTCALTLAGGVMCWGSNGSGELGDGTRTDRHVPIRVVGLSSGVAAVAAGSGFSCALSATGSVRCWGILGSAAILDSAVPTGVGGVESGVSAISAGSGHACAVTVGGAAKCWGANVYGKLGNGAHDSPTVGSAGPLSSVDVVGLAHGVSMISAGYQQTCAIVSGCHVLCWGINLSGELGNNSKVPSSDVPVPVSE